VEEGDPVNYVSDISMPIQIHHAKSDPVVPFLWSVGLASKLYHFDKVFELYSYDCADHLLTGAMRAMAIERDVAFFRKYGR
jgi:fermentation-respiration switch protein FrsA (DUF1100 family)